MVIFQGFCFQRDIMALTLWCCIVQGSVVFLFSIDAPGESSKRPPQPKTPALQVLQLLQDPCVCLRCALVYVCMCWLDF